MRGAVGGHVLSGLRNCYLTGACLALLGAVSAAQAQSDFYTVSGYDSGKLNKLNTGAKPNTKPGQNGSVAAGVGASGAQTSIYVVNGHTVEQYNAQGQLANTISVTNADGSQHSFNKVGNSAVAPDRSFLIVPEQSNNSITKVALPSGKVVSAVAFRDAHNVAIGPGNTIFADSQSSNQGVWSFDSNLGNPTVSVPSGANGLVQPGTLVVSNGTLYVDQGPAVYQYSVTGSSNSPMVAFISSGPGSLSVSGSSVVSSGAAPSAPIVGGSSRGVGPVNGNVAQTRAAPALGGIGGGSNPGTNNGTSTGTGTTGQGGSANPDTGTHTPEPGTVALLTSLGMASYVAARRRRRGSK